jgi:hypothetical protein
MSKIISWALAQLGLALVCFILYNITLIDLFSLEISYIQWVSIILISACIFPERKTIDSSNKNKEESNLDTFVDSIIKRNKGGKR